MGLFNKLHILNKFHTATVFTTNLMADRQQITKQKTTEQVTLKALVCLLSSSVIFLSGCGFQLRGDNSSRISSTEINSAQTNSAKTVAIKTSADKASMAIKRPLIQQLNILGITTLNEGGFNPNHSSNSGISDNTYSHIKIDNINFRKYKLVGVLTEIRVVIVAKVTYNIVKDGKNTSHIQPLQIEKNYQFNEASVSVEDGQGEQIRDWLSEALARRIADQYVALSN